MERNVYSDFLDSFVVASYNKKGALFDYWSTNEIPTFREGTPSE